MPASAAHRFNLGFALQQLGDWSAAEVAFLDALHLSPGLDLAWYGLGDVLMQQGRWQDAEQAWVRQSELQPLCPDGWVRLISLHAERGHWAQVRRCLDRLGSFDPKRAMCLEQKLEIPSDKRVTDCPA